MGASMVQCVKCFESYSYDQMAGDTCLNCLRSTKNTPLNPVGISGDANVAGLVDALMRVSYLQRLTKKGWCGVALVIASPIVSAIAGSVLAGSIIRASYRSSYSASSTGMGLPVFFLAVASIMAIAGLIMLYTGRETYAVKR